MKPSNDLLSEIEKAVLEMAPGRIETIFNSKKITSISDDDLLTALTRGLHTARKRLGTATASVAEFLLSIDAMQEGLKYLTSFSSNDTNKPCVVIGVIQGDVHDLGANIVAGVMETMGYRIHNLGIGTGPDHFIQALKDADASILGLSSMMSTTIEEMKVTIERCRQELPEVKIIVGGAALDEDLAKKLGADAYSASAVELPDTMEKIEQLIHPDGFRNRKYMDYGRKVQMIEPESP